MAREYFEPYRPKDKALDLLQHIVKIVDEYAKMELTLTLRQLYYQLVSKDLIENVETQYKLLSHKVSLARRGGILDWDALEDRIRRPQRAPQFENLQELLEAAKDQYRLPRLDTQDVYVELWVEKDALAGVLAPIAHKYHVTLMVNRGYSSTSAMKDAGERIRIQCERSGARDAHILYLGDFDPSGEDMVRDVQERVEDYTNNGWIVKTVKKGNKMETVLEKDADRRARLRPIAVEVSKLALTKDQIEEYDPPPNPAKTTDSRYKKFSEEHGDESWEVDALPPVALRDIIEEKLDELIDEKLLKPILKKEEADKKRIQSFINKISKKRTKK